MTTVQLKDRITSLLDSLPEAKLAVAFDFVQFLAERELQMAWLSAQSQSAAYQEWLSGDNDIYDEVDDVIVAPCTSNVSRSQEPTQYLIADAEIITAGIKVPSVVRCEALMTVPRTLIVRAAAVRSTRSREHLLALAHYDLLV